MDMVKYLLKQVSILANQMREEPCRRKELSEQINQIYGQIQIYKNGIQIRDHESFYHFLENYKKRKE